MPLKCPHQSVEAKCESENVHQRLCLVMDFHGNAKGIQLGDIHHFISYKSIKQFQREHTVNLSRQAIALIRNLVYHLKTSGDLIYEHGSVFCNTSRCSKNVRRTYSKEFKLSIVKAVRGYFTMLLTPAKILKTLIASVALKHGLYPNLVSRLQDQNLESS